MGSMSSQQKKEIEESRVDNAVLLALKFEGMAHKSEMQLFSRSRKRQKADSKNLQKDASLPTP